jgi:hypothetical protein
MLIGILSTLVFPIALLQTPVAPSEHEACQTHAEALFDALDGARYDAAIVDFDTALRARYPATKLQQDYESLPSSYGKMLGRGRPHIGDMGGRAVVMAPLIFERGTLTAEVHCDADGTISDLRLLPTQVMSKP